MITADYFDYVIVGAGLARCVLANRLTEGGKATVLLPGSDASFLIQMPSALSIRLNAPTIMLGEKGADLVMGRPPLAALNNPVCVAANWQTAQR